MLWRFEMLRMIAGIVGRDSDFFIIELPHKLASAIRKEFSIPADSFQ
jgi:hypothetical protein